MARNGSWRLRTLRSVASGIAALLAVTLPALPSQAQAPSCFPGAVCPEAPGATGGTGSPSTAAAAAAGQVRLSAQGGTAAKPGVADLAPRADGAAIDLRDRLSASARAGLAPAALPAPAVLTWVSSWYGHEQRGASTASGVRFDPNGLTAAHRSLPFGTYLGLRNPRTGRSTVVKVTDRGPFVRGRQLDVSLGAARVLGFVGSGVARLQVKILGKRLPVTPATADGAVGVSAQEARVAAGSPVGADLPQESRVGQPSSGGVAASTERASEVSGGPVAARGISGPRSVGARQMKRRPGRRPRSPLSPPSGTAAYLASSLDEVQQGAREGRGRDPGPK
ncbi:MAG: septal ring lytic transglycosylase RlpA family protein [Actinomycetota bacterium]